MAGWPASAACSPAMNANNVMRRSLTTGPGAFVPHVSRPARSNRTKPLPPGKKLIVADEMPKGRALVLTEPAPVRQMTVVAWKPRTEEVAAELVRGDRLAAVGTGIAACACVGAWWLIVVLDGVATHWLKQPASLWDRLASPAFLVALFGSHALAVTAGAAFRARQPWGVRAVAAFWASLLLWLPLGTLVAMVWNLFV